MLVLRVIMYPALRPLGFFCYVLLKGNAPEVLRRLILRKPTAKRRKLLQKLLEETAHN